MKVKCKYSKLFELKDFDRLRKVMSLSKLANIYSSVRRQEGQLHAPTTAR